MSRGLFVSFAFLLLASTSGFATESRYILRTPSTAVLPAWGIGLDVTGRSFIGTPANKAAAKSAANPEMALSLGLFGRADVGVRWNSGDTDFKAVTAEVKALLLEDKGMIPAFTVGMIGIGSEKYPFADSFAPGEGQAGATMKNENNSWYAELSKDVPFLGSVFLGMGRGRFEGHGANNERLHGLFGGWRHYVVGPLWGAVEIDGRSGNAGLGVSMDVMDKLAINASVRGEFLQHARDMKDGDDLPAIGAALELVYVPFSCKKEEAKKTDEMPVTQAVKPVVAATPVKKVPAQAVPAATVAPAAVVAPKPVVRKKAVVAPVAAPATAPVVTPKPGTGK